MESAFFPPKEQIHRLIREVLVEDIGQGDVTTAAVLTDAERGEGKAVAKTELVVAGLDVFREAFLLLDKDIIFTPLCRDGDRVKEGDVMARLEGALAPMLMAERSALNLLQRMCGIATATERFVRTVEGTKARILDTRKTAPGLRVLDKYAVLVGGGCNHRFALYDGVLIKENHIAAAGGIAVAVERARARVPHTLKIEVEVSNIKELEEALAVQADIVMLDNMDLDQMKRAVEITGGRVPLEASGNVTLERVRAIAETGVDFISVGALTHSVQAADISLLISPLAH
ncbi:MAG: carboxylating nicotinate-nucleotide diphosphorylase [Smithellaceae bacterium]|nr:carboxylating nicotinate-nucleotide diphosphorylase [Smithellaceae bacterium]